MILTLDNLKPRKENYSVDVDDIDVGGIAGIRY